LGILNTLFGSYSKRELKRIQPLAEHVIALEKQYSEMSDQELKDMTGVLKEKLANGMSLDDILPDAFATCREASWRVLTMKHFPVQVVGGIVLHQGRISEMKTGEGKTLVATLPAYLNALSGKGVHIVTVNDYLARRDSEWMGKIFRYLGLTVGLVCHGIENEQRRAAYACDITYGTNNEFGFDYLRDNMVTYIENKVQRGHNYSIVDEVDSILIDEARTPLIISGQGDKSTDMYMRADRFAKTLEMVKVKELNEKEDNSHIGGDFIVDEKAKTATLTAEGVKKAEEYFSIENLTDADNLTIAHHINQAIRAQGIMVRDVDYVVKDDEVIIVDEFTGRLMFGRRYNEGLHQAIEAKEGVKVERESKTLATITFQNYFRLYTKLAGMTGTAQTEEMEFREIYKLDVIEIPTNKDMVRTDHSDSVYKTEKGKFDNVIKQIIECHEKGQPVLVGTISIEKSEHLSSLLKKQGVKHEVLNAKNHEKEAEIVSQAGKKGAVTIATNMAGRGTDIILGGNAEFYAKTQMRKLEYSEELISESSAFGDTEDEEILAAREKFIELNSAFKKEVEAEAEEVKAAGGLYIIGTERHESRRIDNQLRGRAGRQGDSGESKFYLSMEDDLMRLFGGERMSAILDTLKVEEDMPIEYGMLTKTIENAQKKIEGRNFAIRKNVLQYDDVMNRQRELIYTQRDKVLNGEVVKDYILKMVEESITNNVHTYLSDEDNQDEWNLAGLKDFYLGWLLSEDDLEYSEAEMNRLERDYLVTEITDKAMELYEQREESFGDELMRELERVILLRCVDTKWMDHIDDMEELKKGINLRAYGQRDPAIEYKIEGFDMYDAMVEAIREDTVKLVLTAQIRGQEEPKREQVAQETSTSADEAEPKKPVTRKGSKIGRNDPCPCGSGKKYKHCCGGE